MRRTIFGSLAVLLVGLITSFTTTSALADAAADYNSTSLNCVGCHGTPPGTGMVKWDINKLNMDFSTNTDLANFIATNMPPSNPGACAGTCAQQMADYLRPPPNNPPVANATNTSPLSGTVPLTVNFSGTASSDDHGIVSYTWNFGDGTSTSSSSATASHKYTTAGTYNVTLTVTDAQGLTNTSSPPLKVTATTASIPPVANASKSSNLSGTAPLTVKLDASASTCPNGCTQFNSYGWNFSEGGNTIGLTTTRTYNLVGTYTVTLVVTDDQGLKSTAAPLTVTVTASPNAPIADASISSNLIGAAPLTGQFDASLSSCSNTCGSYVWNFGDGSTTTVTDASTPTAHTYSNPGTYTVTLTVNDKSNGKKATATLQVKVVPSESLTTYVQACQTQLGFTGTTIPNLDCYDGDLFVKSDDPLLDPINDYVGYKKITDQVDVAFACRWLFGDKANRTNPISVEMLVHNRSSGNTCYFSAKGPLSGNTTRPDSHILSPNDPNATTFWDPPATVDGNVRCILCHISGPYIATPLVAPTLAKYGLLNNGHDTLSNVSKADLSTPNKNVKYHAISATINGVPNAGAFSQWDSLKQSYIHPNYIDPSFPGCSMGCHSVGALSPQENDITRPFALGSNTVLTSPLNQLQKISDAGVMPPYQDWSDYRWINLSIPDAGTENETFANAKSASTTLVPKLLSSCVDPANTSNAGVPVVMEAHVVGSDNEFVIAQPGRFAFLPDRLATFNLKDGLTCLNSDQDAGQPKCSDYSVQYECTTINATTNSRTWVNWPTHALRSDGDHEERNGANPCPSGSTATSIQASVVLINGWTYSSVGPNDRLAAFSQYGLTCNNSDQPDNKCSNYVVRFSSCTTPPPTQSSKTLTNESTLLGAKQLTSAANSLVKAQGHNGGWNTQAWTIETIAYTEYVRIRIPNQNVYLNVSSQADPTAVSTATLNTGWTSEMWLIEPVSGSSYVRLKNLWTGKYLTMADPTTITDPTLKDYIPIYSQGRNTGWNTQRWLIQ